MLSVYPLSPSAVPRFAHVNSSFGVSVPVGVGLALDAPFASPVAEAVCEVLVLDGVWVAAPEELSGAQPVSPQIRVTDSPVASSAADRGLKVL